MKYLPLAILAFMPFIAQAQTTFKTIIELFLRALSNFIQIGIALIVLGIIYAVVLYLANGDNEQKREQIKGYLVYALIGLSVVIGLWGLVELISSTVFGGSFGIPMLSVG